MPRSIPPLQWPKIYEMVDMEGLDLAEANGHAVSGIYAKITSALGSDNIEYWYNMYFAGILIAPAKFYINTEVSGQYVINDVILIKSDDTISLVGLTPDPPVITELTVTENGTYNAPQGVDGFDPVSVNVPSISPVLVTLNALQNGQYLPAIGQDGFNIVNVNVPDIPPVLEALSVTENGTYTPSQGYDGFNEVIVNVPQDYPTLPVEYQEVEYLECYGAQYAQQDGIHLYVGDIISSAASLDTSVESSTEDGIMGGGRSSSYEIYFKNDTLKFYGRITGTEISIQKGVKYPLTGTINNLSGSADDFSLGRYYSSYVHVGKIWRTTIQRNTFRGSGSYITPDFPPTIFRDFVPCYRKLDNKPGFFELFSSTFLTNLGSGEFGLGPEI